MITSRWRQRLIAGAAGSALALAGVVALAPAANASVAQCNSGNMCGFKDAGYSGGVYQAGTYRADWGTHKNWASSLYNHTSKWGNYYTGVSFTGNSNRLQPGEVYSDLYWLGTNDAIKSSRTD